MKVQRTVKTKNLWMGIKRDGKPMGSTPTMAGDDEIVFLQDVFLGQLEFLPTPSPHRLLAFRHGERYEAPHRREVVLELHGFLPALLRG